MSDRVMKGGHLSKKAIQPFEYKEKFAVLEQPTEEAGEETPYLSLPDEIIEEADKEAKLLLEAAREEAEQIRRDAWEEGKQAGYDDGVRQAYEEHQVELGQRMSEFAGQIAEELEDMALKKEKVLEKYIDDLKKIALAVAEKIIRISLKSSGEVIKRMILGSTDKLKKTQWVKIYITRNDQMLMAHGDQELINELSHLSDNIKIILMDNEEEGTCILEMPEEVIDVSVDTQLENIKDIVNNARI